MTTDTFRQMSRQIAPSFNRASERFKWSAESAFFEKQVRDCKAKIDGDYRYVLMEGITNGVQETIDACMGAARQIAAMGLSCNPTAKLVYFIPRRMRERYNGESASEFARVPWVVDATPSYMGLAYIGTHYASARVFGASEVYAADKIKLRGPFELPVHEPTTDVTKRDEKQAIGVYAAAVLQSGDARVEYVDAPTVQKIRGLSKLSNSLMYTTVWTEGWKKIAIRRLSKLVMQAEPHMLEAEDAMKKAEGFTFDESGNPVDDVPRGTPEGAPPQPAEKPRGMSGLKSKMQRQEQRAAEHEEPQVAGMEPEKPALLALPAPSAHPPGSIEWWLDQVHASADDGRLDAIKVAALTAKVDASDDADTFRKAFAVRRRELREGSAP